MKTTLCLVVVAALLFSASAPESNSDTPVKGAWKLVRAQYGNDPLEDLGPDELTHKLFTGTRWSTAYYNKATKKISGTGGGTYKIKGDQYIETVEYFSWDAAVEGTTGTFTMTLEKGMLHQKGTFVYEGNPNYIVDEWYIRVD
jgi:hypothetical protein